MKIRHFIIILLLFAFCKAYPSAVGDLLTSGASVALDKAAADSSVYAMSPPAPQHKSPPPCIYDMPYSLNGNYPNYGRLAANSAVLMGGGIITMGVLELLPEDATEWNKAEEKKTPMFQRWYNNVMKGPVIDNDSPIFNYILHPYAGAAYYMSARSQGFNVWRSWLYCFCVSTFFWEFGFEAFNEEPSWQDLIITPMSGLLLGEAFYLGKRYIVQHDYELLGTKWLGYPVAFLLDPVNECLGYFRGNRAHGWGGRHAGDGIELHFTPTVTPVRGAGATYGFTMAMTF